MNEDKMRAALEDARHLLTAEHNLNAFEGTYLSEKVFVLDHTKVIQQIDDILNEKPLAQLIQELPDKIRAQSLKVAELAQKMVMQEKRLGEIKITHREFVISAKEGDKPKFTNEEQRKIALENSLKGDREFLDLYDALSRNEYQLKVEQIELGYLNDLFSAYRTTATIQGVR